MIKRLYQFPFLMIIILFVSSSSSRSSTPICQINLSKQLVIQFIKIKKEACGENTQGYRLIRKTRGDLVRICYPKDKICKIYKNSSNDIILEFEKGATFIDRDHVGHCLKNGEVISSNIHNHRENKEIMKIGLCACKMTPSTLNPDCDMSGRHLINY